MAVLFHLINAHALKVKSLLDNSFTSLPAISRTQHYNGRVLPHYTIHIVAGIGFKYKPQDKTFSFPSQSICAPTHDLLNYPWYLSPTPSPLLFSQNLQFYTASFKTLLGIYAKTTRRQLALP